jgi:hypothetical protein
MDPVQRPFVGNVVAVTIIVLSAFALVGIPFAACPACHGTGALPFPRDDDSNTSYAALGLRCGCSHGRVTLFRRVSWREEEGPPLPPPKRKLSARIPGR